VTELCTTSFASASSSGERAWARIQNCALTPDLLAESMRAHGFKVTHGTAAYGMILFDRLLL